MGGPEPLRNGDLTELARLHRAALPDSAFSLLGQKALESYYDSLLKDPVDLVVVERLDGHIVGGCVLSYQPGRLARKTLMQHPFVMGTALLRAMISSAALRRKLLGFISEDAPCPAEVRELPELVQIYTDSRYRNQKIGTRLLEKLENCLGGKPYYLKTEDVQDNQAIHFYMARDFALLKSAPSLGKQYLFFRKG